MKFNFDENPASLTVAAYAKGWVRVRDTHFRSPCVVTPVAVHTDLLPDDLDGLTASHFEGLLALSPEIILLGTGARQRFIDHALAGVPAARGVGLEIMDTGAACRSFNILVAEDRAVVAALFMI